jgi:hypothetical protein
MFDLTVAEAKFTLAGKLDELFFVDLLVVVAEEEVVFMVAGKLVELLERGVISLFLVSGLRGGSCLSPRLSEVM